MGTEAVQTPPALATFDHPPRPLFAGAVSHPGSSSSLHVSGERGDLPAQFIAPLEVAFGVLPIGMKAADFSGERAQPG